MAAPPMATPESISSVRAGPRAPQALKDCQAKRALDLLLASAGLLAAAPLMLAVAALVRVNLGPGVIFAQTRVGLGGRPFLLYKFRTLRADASPDPDRDWWVEPPNRLMAFLRDSGLDELPQLFNVLRGEMSLVGPRPERPHFAARFQAGLSFYEDRHLVRPGITGWAQIHGLRGDTSIARRLEYDLHYVRNRSLGLDLRILARTVSGFFKKLTCGGGASGKANHAGLV